MSFNDPKGYCGASGQRAEAMTERPAVRAKPDSYQPSKAETEETIIPRKPDESVPTPQELARAVLQPVSASRTA